MIRVIPRIAENQIVPSIISLTVQNLAVDMTYQAFVIAMSQTIAQNSQRLLIFCFH